MYVLSFPSEQSHYTFGLSTKGYSMPVFLQRYILSTVFVLMLVASSTSQVVRPSLSVGFMNGGRATTSNFYFKSGLSASVTAFINTVNPKITPGFSIGVERLDSETLIPLGLEYQVLLSDKTHTGFLTIGGGYAFAAKNEEYENADGFDYQGGAFFNPGWGYRWSLNSGDHLFVAIKYKHQFMKTEFHSQGKDVFTDRYNYMLLHFTTGIIF
jgi:hypothetical protein